MPVGRSRTSLALVRALALAEARASALLAASTRRSAARSASSACLWAALADESLSWVGFRSLADRCAIACSAASTRRRWTMAAAAARRWADNAFSKAWAACAACCFASSSPATSAVCSAANLFFSPSFMAARSPSESVAPKPRSLTTPSSSIKMLSDPMPMRARQRRLCPPMQVVRAHEGAIRLASATPKAKRTRRRRGDNMNSGAARACAAMRRCR